MEWTVDRSTDDLYPFSVSFFGCLNQASNLEDPGISVSSYLELVSETTKNNLGHSMVRLLSPEHNI